MLNRFTPFVAIYCHKTRVIRVYIPVNTRTYNDVLDKTNEEPSIIGINTKNIPANTATPTDADCFTTSVGDLNSNLGNRILMNNPSIEDKNPADIVKAKSISHWMKVNPNPM